LTSLSPRAVGEDRRGVLIKHGGIGMNEKQMVEAWSDMKAITEHLGVSRETILLWINMRKMPASKVGRRWKFKKSEVDEWIRSGGASEKIEKSEKEN
jgi:excisionase family DNA binding protein